LILWNYCVVIQLQKVSFHIDPNILSSQESSIIIGKPANRSYSHKIKISSRSLSPSVNIGS
jgi:hypothetical protein